jgi:hypothetical protein
MAGESNARPADHLAPFLGSATHHLLRPVRARHEATTRTAVKITSLLGAEPATVFQPACPKHVDNLLTYLI